MCRSRSPDSACKDETRFQGIATAAHRVSIPSAPRNLARTRPVFRGLRLHGGPQQDLRGLPDPCKDETRFQGIATILPTQISARAWKSLQGRDPFSGDCDLPGQPRNHLSLFHNLQGRDPFSGDCDRAATKTRLGDARPPGLQGRDPFSGDCDMRARVTRRMTGSVNLQGRDPFSGDCDLLGRPHLGSMGAEVLARTRPVFRGLRLPPGQLPDGLPRVLRLARTRPVFRGLRPSYSPSPFAGNTSGLARTRPVFRGLRRANRAASWASRVTDLQGRDPFSGDCDARASASLLYSSKYRRLARTRPVFRGLRRRLDAGDPGASAILARTRPVFRGLRLRVVWERRRHVLELARTRPVFRGLRRGKYPMRP